MTNREIDALVAEKIMGWTYRKPDPKYISAEGVGSYVGFILQPPKINECYERYTCAGQLTFYGYPPHYSTDIAAAWEVAEQMKLKLVVDGVFGFWRVIIGPVGERNVFCVAEEETAPKAICLAALKAVGVEVE